MADCTLKIYKLNTTVSVKRQNSKGTTYTKDASFSYGSGEVRNLSVKITLSKNCSLSGVVIQCNGMQNEFFSVDDIQNDIVIENAIGTVIISAVAVSTSKNCCTVLFDGDFGCGAQATVNNAIILNSMKVQSGWVLSIKYILNTGYDFKSFEMLYGDTKYAGSQNVVRKITISKTDDLTIKTRSTRKKASGDLSIYRYYGNNLASVDIYCVHNGKTVYFNDDDYIDSEIANSHDIYIRYYSKEDAVISAVSVEIGDTRRNISDGVETKLGRVSNDICIYITGTPHAKLLRIYSSDGVSINVIDEEGRQYFDFDAVPINTYLRISHSMLPNYTFESYKITQGNTSEYHELGDIVFINGVKNSITIDIKTKPFGSIRIFDGNGYSTYDVYIANRAGTLERYIPLIYTNSGWMICD